MSEYIDILQDIENDYESQLLNDFYNQEDISKSLTRKKIEKYRKKYYEQKMLEKILKDKMNANNK